MVYVPISREGRRKWPKEDLIYRPQLREPDNEYCTSVFHTELASPRLETAVPPPVNVDVEVPSCREIERDNCPRKRAGKDLDITGVINAELNDHDDLEYGDRPVADVASELIIRPDEILVVDTIPAVIDHPEPRENGWCESGKRNIPVRSEEMTFVCLLPKTVLPGTHQQAEMIDIKLERLDHQCGVCWYPDSNNHPDAYICWNCRCLMALCCCVSCLVTVVTSRLIGIDQFIDCLHTYTWGSGLLGNPMMPCDVIRLCAKMNRNFKGGIDNVMIEYNDTVDSRGLQRCTDGHRSSLAHALARDKPIREKGRFGYVGAPVTDANWLYGARFFSSR